MGDARQELPRQGDSGWRALYKVPRSQVWEGSGGRQSGAIHLVSPAPLMLTAKRGRCGTLRRKTGQTLCGTPRGWYEREPDGDIRCSECSRMARRYGIEWPEAS